jgi:hypothetical protein
MGIKPAATNKGTEIAKPLAPGSAEKDAPIDKATLR